MRVPYIFAGLGLIVICGVVLVVWDPIGLKERFTSADESDTEVLETATDPNRIVFSPESVSNIVIKTGQASEKMLSPTRIIPGRLDYDQTKHVMVRSATPGVITKILVLPGEKVEAGDIVAEVSSPEVGAIRSEISQRQAELELVKKRLERDQNINQGVDRLVSEILSRAAPREIELAMEGLSLGQYREKLVSAYTRKLLASQLQTNIRDAVASGAVASKVQSERQSESQAADAALKAAIDQTVFDVEQQQLQSRAEVAKANRDLQISFEKLKLLLGPAASVGDLSAPSGSPNEELSRVNLVSPISGIVQEQLVAAFERVDSNQDIILVADTSHLWAVADIRESDWPVTNLKPGDQVTFTSPLLIGKQFEAQIRTVGPRIDPLTGAMPLIAELLNVDANLRPGMFIRMKVQESQPRAALTVPEPAIAVHEGTSFVFVPDGELAYRRVDVTTGENVGPDTEILSGLKAGDAVVIEGTFKLQSELLLAGEEE